MGRRDGRDGRDGRAELDSTWQDMKKSGITVNNLTEGHRWSFISREA